ncbi:MAG TPA: hypothetical protein VJX72_05985 [Candidatus Acidoferrum sp.]|nr:hypothetical protein [Candidatus Acidoferrum sp.]
MTDEGTKRAAEEYLAARLSEDRLTYEERLNRDAAITLAPMVWKRVKDTIITKCVEWNAVTQEQTLTCKETVLGDLRVRCAGRTQQMVVHFDSRKRVVTVENSARQEHEPKVILRIEGYSTDSGRDAHLVRNNEPVNLDMLFLGQLRVLAGLSRKMSG